MCTATQTACGKDFDAGTHTAVVYAPTHTRLQCVCVCVGAYTTAVWVPASEAFPRANMLPATLLYRFEVLAEQLPQSYFFSASIVINSKPSVVFLACLASMLQCVPLCITA